VVKWTSYSKNKQSNFYQISVETVLAMDLEKIFPFTYAIMCCMLTKGLTDLIDLLKIFCH